MGINEVRLPAVIDLFCSGYLKVSGWKKVKNGDFTNWENGHNRLELRPVTKLLDSEKHHQEVFCFYYFRNDELKASFEISEDAWFEQFIGFVSRMHNILADE
jgi:hypothetical protein